MVSIILTQQYPIFYKFFSIGCGLIKTVYYDVSNKGFKNSVIFKVGDQRIKFLLGENLVHKLLG